MGPTIVASKRKKKGGQKLIFIELLLCAWHCDKRFTYLIYLKERSEKVKFQCHF